MKKVVFVFVLCLSLGTIFAQSSVESKKAGNEALKAKDYAKALENYEKAISVWGTDSMDFAMIYNTAICAFQIKNYAKAVTYFDKAYVGKYKPEDSFFNKAMMVKLQKNNEEYVKLLNEGITKFPANVKFKSELSKFYLTEGSQHYNNGATILKGAIDNITAKKFKDTKDPAYKSEIEKVKKEFSAAIPSLVKALELNPDDANAKKLKASSEQQLKTL